MTGVSGTKAATIDELLDVNDSLQKSQPNTKNASLAGNISSPNKKIQYIGLQLPPQLSVANQHLSSPIATATATLSSSSSSVVLLTKTLSKRHQETTIPWTGNILYQLSDKFNDIVTTGTNTNTNTNTNEAEWTSCFVKVYPSTSSLVLYGYGPNNQPTATLECAEATLLILTGSSSSPATVINSTDANSKSAFTINDDFDKHFLLVLKGVYSREKQTTCSIRIILRTMSDLWSWSVSLSTLCKFYESVDANAEQELVSIKAKEGVSTVAIVLRMTMLKKQKILPIKNT